MGPDGGVSAGGGRAGEVTAGFPSPRPVRGARAAWATNGSTKKVSSCSPGRAPRPGSSVAGVTAAWTGLGFVACRPGRGRKGLATGGGPNNGGRVRTPGLRSGRGMPRLRLLVSGKVSACLCAAIRSAPGPGARGALSSRGGFVRINAAVTIGGTATGPGTTRGRESRRKAQVLHRGAGISSVPPRKYTGRLSGKHHLLWQRAHRAAHHGCHGPPHSGATTSIRLPSRDALVTTSSRRLNGGFAQRGPALG